MNNKVVIGGNLKLKNVVSGQAKLNNAISGTPKSIIQVNGKGGGITDAVKAALLDCFQHVAWVDEDGQDYYDALYDALYAQTVVSITAVFEQGQAVIYSDDSLDDLKQYLTVTASYDDGTSAVVTGYTLSGTLTAGTSVITVTYEGKKAYFNVTVTERPALVSISAVYTQSGTVYEDTPLNDLKTDLVVTATYSDSSTETVPSADYTLSGTLTEGTSTVTITYEGKTTTFTVTVTANSIYTLPNTPVTFDGTNYVQTDVKLMETDISFTILMSWKNGDLSTVDRPTLFHCLNEGGSPWQGLSIYQNNSGTKPFVLSGQSSTATELTGYSTNENAEIKMIIRHTAGETTYIVDGTSNGVRQTQVVSTRGKNPYLTTYALWIGKNRVSNRPFYGTVYDFRIKATVLTDDDVTAYLGS